MYIYHALINALSAHIIHTNLNMIFCAHVETVLSKTIYIKYYMETHTHIHHNKFKCAWHWAVSYICAHTHMHERFDLNILSLSLSKLAVSMLKLETWLPKRIRQGITELPSLILPPPPLLLLWHYHRKMEERKPYMIFMFLLFLSVRISKADNCT